MSGLEESSVETPNYAEMSDEEIMNLDPSGLPGGSPVPDEGSAEPSGEADHETGEGEEAGKLEDNSQVTPEDTGGADPEAGASDDSEGEPGAVEEGEGDDPADPFAGGGTEDPEDDQSKDKDSGQDPDENQQPDDFDYKAAYEGVLEPFKASGQTVTPESIEDLRRMAQMGFDYSRKMGQMKPHLRLVRTLEKANLTDADSVNFLLELQAGKPEAIKKLLKDNSIDPMDLDLEGSESYKPNDHIVGETEMNLTTAFQSIESAPGYKKTLENLDKMDQVSKQQLQDNPGVIPEINAHIEAGIYDKIVTKVEYERMLGRLTGLSDLDAYYQVGTAMHKAGILTDSEDASESTGGNPQASAQGNGSPTGNKPSAKDLKRAAAPNRGGAAGGGGKKVPDLKSMTDEEIMNLDISSL